MDRLFEILMTLCLDAAMLVFVLSLARSGGKSVAHARLISITMSVGFLLGAAAHCIDGVNAALLLDALGFILSYTAALFTFPPKRTEVRSDE